MSPPARVVAVARDDRHRFSKPVVEAVVLRAGHGVEGDVHAGATVRHRHDRRRHPGAPNRKQVHLLGSEVLAELAQAGHDVGPGQLGENVTTSGLDLVALPLGTRLTLGPDAVVELTGLRTPCVLIDRYRRGVLRRLLTRVPDGTVRYRAGVMAVVLAGGPVGAGDEVGVELPPGPHRPLPPV